MKTLWVFRLCICLSVSWILLSANNQNTALAKTAVENKCTTCHTKFAANKFEHAPVKAGLCTTCHTVPDAHFKGKGKVITKKLASDCYSCHVRKDTGSTVHGALGNPESCITCHNPHGGNQRYFIKLASVKILCLNCHDDKVSVYTKVKHGSAVDQNSCMNCHNPHSSNNKKLLKLASRDLCLSCHDKTIPATLSEARIIPNIKEKVENFSTHSGALLECTSCHNPHGSENNRILIDNYALTSNNLYPGTGKNPYALCFNCHDSNMLNSESYTTGYRTGPHTNFHNSHVVNAGGNPDKSNGVACRVCHDPHGSNQHFSINEFWKQNGKTIKNKYNKTENGGQCATSCHFSSVRSYHRI